jgi:hypothetical protein
VSFTGRSSYPNLSRRPVFQLGRQRHSPICVPWLQPAILGYGLGNHVGRARPWHGAAREAGLGPVHVRTGTLRRGQPGLGRARARPALTQARPPTPTPALGAIGPRLASAPTRAQEPSAGARIEPRRLRDRRAPALGVAQARPASTLLGRGWPPARGAGSAMLRREHDQPDPCARAHARCSATPHGATCARAAGASGVGAGPRRPNDGSGRTVLGGHQPWRPSFWWQGCRSAGVVRYPKRRGSGDRPRRATRGAQGRLLHGRRRPSTRGGAQNRSPGDGGYRGG